MNRRFKKLHEFLSNHKSGCSRVSEECNCGRNKALVDLWLAEDIAAFIVKLDEYLNGHDSVASNSFAHVELDLLIERLK